MSTAAAFDYTYLYSYASGVGEYDKGFGLRLATCGAHQEHPYFFEGRLRRPRMIGDMLLVLSNVVRTHFFLQSPVLLDPVITSSETILRFEGFSGCCGVYVRADLLPESFDCELQHRGTTNVDFNNPMRASLSRLQDREGARLSVGSGEVKLERSGESVIEKKVKLPIRWIKGFCEVQSYQGCLQLKHELPIGEVRRFIQGLPRGTAPKQASYITIYGKGLRLSQRPSSGAIRINGTERLRVIEPLLGNAQSVRIWSDEESGVSGWEILYDTGTFFLLISPEIYRGFSGEGQALERLAKGNWQEAMPHVRAQLSWQSQLDSEILSQRTGLSEGDVQSALAVLGSRGLVGYDVGTGCYFHRELPFDLELVDQLQPRLKNAKKLLEEGKVELTQRRNNETMDFLVQGTDVKHTVQLRANGDKCTCPWFSKYQGERGPCKHILAATLFTEGSDKKTS